MNEKQIIKQFWGLFLRQRTQSQTLQFGRYGQFIACLKHSRDDLQAQDPFSGYDGMIFRTVTESKTYLAVTYKQLLCVLVS